MSNDIPGSGGCLNTYLLLKHSLAIVEKTVLGTGKGEARFSSRARGTSRPKMGKPTVLLTGAKVVQERVDYIQHRQTSQ